ncbi:MAG: WYL domain-containing transcriptional regulator [Polyangiaceae bacterium]|nr:WYL domain-containing transcriptional regulator [Polyangiaceae bacterium]
MARRDHIARVLAVGRELTRARNGLPLKVLAERNGWPLRALYRDLRTLEDAGFEVTNEGGRYRILTGSCALGPEGIETEERLAMMAAREAAAGWRETSLGRALERLWNKLSASGGGQTGRGLGRGCAPWFGQRGPLSVDYSVHRSTIAALERAIRERRVVQTRYLALSTGAETERDLEPGELYWDAGLESLYCIAFCRLRQDVRVFAVHRFVSAVATESSFVPRAEARSKAALRDAFRVWRSREGAAREVRLRFDGPGARWVRERRFHRTQRLLELPGGGVELSFEVAGVDELVRFVLGFGRDALVLAPPELRARVEAEHSAAASRYATRGLRGGSGGAGRSLAPRAAPRERVTPVGRARRNLATM